MGPCLWGAEIYPTQNRYGRYQSYAPLEVLYTGESIPDNGRAQDGYDWNLMPGVTGIMLPWNLLVAEKDRIDERNTIGFVGANLLGAKKTGVLDKAHCHFGSFTMHFQAADDSKIPNHNPSFTFKKSYFFLGDYIVALGSDIANDDTTNPTFTALYQRLASHPDHPSIQSQVNVNGTPNSTTGSSTLAANQEHWIIDNFNTGYFIPTGNAQIQRSRSTQTTPPHNLTDPADTASYASGDYHAAYLDHGTNPQNASHHFCILPATDATQMQDFVASTQSTNPPYTVHQATGSAHILEEHQQALWCYHLFEAATTLPSDGLLATTNLPCMVMSKTHHPGSVTLTVNDPDLRLPYRSYDPVPDSVVELLIRGQWSLRQAHDQVLSVTPVADDTLLQIRIEEAQPVEIELVDDPDADGFSSAIENLLGSDPNTSESTPNFNPQISATTSDTMHLQFDSYPGLWFEIEHSYDLIQWTPLTTSETPTNNSGITLPAIDPDEVKQFYRMRLLPNYFP